MSHILRHKAPCWPVEQLSVQLKPGEPAAMMHCRGNQLTLGSSACIEHMCVSRCELDQKWLSSSMPAVTAASVIFDWTRMGLPSSCHA